VLLEATAYHLRATIKDDGAGFEPKRARHTPGIGLASMRERVQYVQGTFTMQSAPVQGTVIDLSVPLTRREHEKASNSAC
jgi:signal transduction histidine kinase